MRRALESVYQIISSLSHSSGQGYFDTFVSEIAAAVGADFVLISGRDQAGLSFKVHAAHPASLDITNFSFPVSATLGEITLQEGETWFSDRVQQLFPHAAVLQAWHIQAYAGIALKSAQGETVGICSVLFKRPLTNMDKVMGLLRLLAPLAGRELALMLQQPAPPQPEYHDFLHTMMSHAPVGIGKLDLNGKILWTNPAIEKMLGYSQSELLHRTAAELNHPEDWLRSAACYEELKRGERTAFTQEKRYLHRDGQVLWGRVTVTLVRDDQLQPDYLMVVLENIDPLKRHAEQLKLSHRVYDNLSEAILVCDADSRIISVNPAFEQITGYSEEEVRGQRPSMLKSGLHDQAFYADMYHALERVGVWRGEVWNKRKNGKLYPQQLMISTLREGGRISQYIAIFSDLSQTKLAEQKIAAQANYDNLTGLPNRWLFGRCLSRFCERGERFALMVLDLNNFKAVNNSMDHHAGDALLREVSDRLVSRVRTEDLVARIGGDEFAFLVPGIVNRRQAEVFAKQVIGGFARPFMLANQHLYVTATIGITLCPGDGLESDELLRNAEQALFAAKRQGRLLGSYCASMREEVRQRHQMQQDLAEAIKLEQLTMAYQPIWDNRSGRVAKLEALVRWYHPHWGQVSPADFIPLAEEAGLIQGLGALVLWQSCRDLARLQQSGFPDLQMSINRSTLEFQTIDPEASEWLKVIHHFGLDPADIVIEITESLLMETSDQHRVRIDALREAGCKLAIDDFGTGYSALNYLRNFPVDLVKIDRAFVRHIPFNEQDRLLLDGIINIVHNLGMQVVIEGVETREQLNFLCQKGCAFTQGYLLSRPLAYDDLTEYLQLNDKSMFLQTS
ncbi:diguanylate phosphodiesterase [Aeromonas hydrophila]|uniref:sensor domain-containing phosphodiesterase n=1 Tax=Aeromonas hydrophila TaxID=644 RepID=UPI00053830F4|nr:EAL domain-containing protein [Aeromonas hydrophila]HDT5894385.1 EAL domain-containing protein [Aeromonas hydrophila subsp. hydrophila]KHA56976.1 diguanylate phosphodiesterase [Aeromonas hydrophila]MBL0563215.1 EAL domain-containing protein [Aeromonas hydrophila]QPR88441.1 EAL domain-containing protein [Aeromonas hydrophila]UON53551.1 EAL domain-containing protein [Aeromonas hydrophila]